MSYSLLTSSIKEDLVPSSIRSSASKSFRIAAEQSSTLLFTNNRFAKYIVIPKYRARDIERFVNDQFFKELNLPTKRPGAIISVIGGARYYEISSKIDLVVKRGFIKAAQNLGAWIIDGGMHAGVMKYVGNSIQTMAAKDVPLIGIAPLRKVNHSESLEKMDTLQYQLTDIPEGQDICNLDPNHSQFILVESEVDHWGEETEFLTLLRAHLKEVNNIPVIVIALNGGGVTLEVIANGLEQGFPTIIIVGTGRVCDALAALTRVARKFNTPPATTTCKLLEGLASEEDLVLWHKFMTEEANSHVGLVGTMDKVLKYYKLLKLFDPSELEHEGLDTLVLESYLKTKDTLDEKIRTCIMWGDDAELVQELINLEGPNLKGVNPHEMNLFLTMVKNRPNIFNALCDNHAYFSFPLRILYENNSEIKVQLNRGHRSLAQKILRWPDQVRDKIFGTQVNRRIKSTCVDFEEVMDIITDIGPVFSEYVSLCSKFFDDRPTDTDRATRLSFIDLLVWAIFTNRMELAKVVWKRTKYHAHSALLACNLYSHLAVRAIRTKEYLDNAEWFENEAVRLLNSLDYETAVEMIKFTSSTMLGNYDLADTAGEGECKALMAHPHMQQRLDELLYGYDGHGISSSLSNAHLIADIVMYFPRLFYLWCKPNPGFTVDQPHEVDLSVKGLIASNVNLLFDQHLRSHGISTHAPVKQKTEDNFLKRTPTIYFNIPIVKFWTSTIFYLAFLVLQAYTLITLRDRQIAISEFVLWAWIFSMAVEEVLEITGEDGSGYFSHFTNKMDLTLILLHMVYIALRISHYFTGDSGQWSGAVNSLLVACVISWLRLMAVFPVSSTFGPLFFILIKLFTHDFILWAVLFTLFAISFQIGFTSLAIQAGMSPSEAYPHESGIFPVSYVAIIGEWAYLMDIMAKTPTGVVFLAIYAFIVQVMLVNLLIAMMGDTYSSVRENSDVEWKYFRFAFVQDNMAAGSLPPPLNFIYFIIWVYTGLKNVCKRREASENSEKKEQDRKNEELAREQAIAKVMRVTVDKLAEDTEKEERQSPLVQIQLTKHAVENILHDKNKNELEKHIKQLRSELQDDMNKISKAQKDQLRDINGKLQELDAKIAERETRLENMLAQLTRQISALGAK